MDGIVIQGPGESGKVHIKVLKQGEIMEQSEGWGDQGRRGNIFLRFEKELYTFVKETSFIGRSKKSWICQFLIPIETF